MRDQRLDAWIGLVAIVLNALWLQIASAGQNVIFAPVCTTVGTQSTPANSGLPLRPAPGKLSAPHCPFCPGVSDHTPALAPTLPISIVAPVASAQPVWAELVPSVSFLHLAARPRGPPSRLI